LSRTGPSVAPVSSAHLQTENHGLRIGDEIVHPTFGEGIIINIRGQGEKAEAAIRFRLVGEKHLSLAWAPLKKSGE
jgi:DNA helicase-2/ATP-dependent DNA helicase PcrA